MKMVESVPIVACGGKGALPLYSPLQGMVGVGEMRQC